MTPEIHPSTGADDTIDVALHYDIKRRAYELYERRHAAGDGDDLRDELRRIAYAVSQIQKNFNSEIGDTRAVRAARVYLSALCSFISDHEVRGQSSSDGFMPKAWRKG